MPCNRNKARCAVPGCGSWSMRDHVLCRAHRNAELGPGAAGAPKRNLNALKDGTHSHPLSVPDMDRFVEVLVTRPQDFAYEFGLVAHAIQSRTGDPFRTLLALRGLLPHLTSRLAARVFTEELRTFLQPLPPPLRDRAQSAIEQRVSALSPEVRLLALRKKECKKTINGNGISG